MAPTISNQVLSDKEVAEVLFYASTQLIHLLGGHLVALRDAHPEAAGAPAELAILVECDNGHRFGMSFVLDPLGGFAGHVDEGRSTAVH